MLKVHVYTCQWEERMFQFFHCILDLRHIRILVVSRSDDMADRDLDNHWKDIEQRLQLTERILVRKICLYYAGGQKVSKCGKPLLSPLLSEVP
jgi:hypothetical protein